jgi:hypothetical protein
MACLFVVLDLKKLALTHSIVAKPFVKVQRKVHDLLHGRLLIGHALHNDLEVLHCVLIILSTDGSFRP